MELTQQQIDVLKQNLRRKEVRIELLDTDFKIIDSIEGHAIGGSLEKNADNNIRRSGTVELAIPNNPNAARFMEQLDGFTIEAGGKIWLDKYIRIYIGIHDIHTEEITWYNYGIVLINNPTRLFSGTDFTLSFDCIDLMAKLTGERQGQLTGTTTKIEMGYYDTDESGNKVYVKTRLRDALISTITELGGFNKYIIAPIPTEYEYLPYDITVTVGSTVYDILSKLMEIISTWQMYFDNDGTFVVEPIPDGENAIVYEISKDQYIQDELTFDFENVKNQVIIYGRLNSLTYYTENITDASYTYALSANSGITSVVVDLDTFGEQIDTSGAYAFSYNGNIWELNGNEVALSTYGIEITGTPNTGAVITIEYVRQEPTNVIYQPNADGQTATLVLKYDTVDLTSLTISGTTFGFMSLGQVNTLPITNVEIWQGDERVLPSSSTQVCSLVKFENSTSAFGQTYETTQVEANSILQEDIYFIRIYDATVNENEFVDISQNITFEFMGKQQVAYNMVNDNKESPFYVNEPFDEPNYYCGLAQTPLNAEFGSNYLLTLNNDEPVTELLNGTIITFVANATNIYAENSQFTGINVQTSEGTSLLTNIPLVQNSWSASTQPATRPYVVEGRLSNDFTVWQLRYEKTDNYEWFVLVGRNPNVITTILSDGEYENIYSDQLAYERCLWELFNVSNMNDSISLSIVPNYLLDVNCKIPYNPNDALPHGIYDTQPYYVATTNSNQQYQTAFDRDFYVRKDETQYYITKQVSYPLDLSNQAQTISAIRIYDSGNLVGGNN